MGDPPPDLVGRTVVRLEYVDGEVPCWLAQLDDQRSFRFRFVPERVVENERPSRIRLVEGKTIAKLDFSQHGRDGPCWFLKLPYRDQAQVCFCVRFLGWEGGRGK